MENKPARAELMAEQYGKKLEEISGVKLQPIQLKHYEAETSEILAKRKCDMEKLSTFKDLL